MPPEVLPHYRPVVQFSAHPHRNQPSIHKVIRESSRRMNIPGKKLIPVLIFVLSIISILRLLVLAVNTSIFASHSSSPPLPTSSHGHSHIPVKPGKSTTLTKKEFKLLSRLIVRKSPCNLLIFGLQSEYRELSSINAAGTTVILEDDQDKVREVRDNSNNTQIFKVEYQMAAKEAYKLLDHARQNPDCAYSFGEFQESTCKLAMRNLPKEVHDKKWDVIVIDGPIGNSPEAPGRMEAIYTAGVIARAGNVTEVVVHDVDRTIEKWFSWEFLCDENLRGSKGKLWHFRISGHQNFSRFCCT